MTLAQGTRVLTPYGAGAVVYARMAPPEFREPACYSVKLDARRLDPRYAGTVVPAENVTPEEAAPCAP